MPLKQKCAKTTQTTVQGSLRLLGKQAPVTSHTKFSIIIVNSVPQPWSPLQLWLGPFPAPLSFPFSPTCTHFVKKTPKQHRVDFRFRIETFSLQEHSGMAREHPSPCKQHFKSQHTRSRLSSKTGGQCQHTRAGLSFSPWFHHLHHSCLYERTRELPPSLDRKPDTLFIFENTEISLYHKPKESSAKVTGISYTPAFPRTDGNWSCIGNMTN